MSYIEVTGIINQDGILEAKVPEGTPAGKVSVIIVVDTDDDDDALWNESFRNSKDTLIAMAKKAIADRKAGLNREVDLEVDFNEPDDDPSQ